MKMNLKFLAVLALCAITLSGHAQEQKHEIRVYAGDALPLQVTEALGTGMFDAITGTRNHASSSGMFGVGYRYQINRFRIGGDLGFYSEKNNVTLPGSKVADLREDTYHLLVIPTSEFMYYKKGIVELYGSGGAGVIFSNIGIKGLTNAGVEFDKKFRPTTMTNFAFQVNPIAIRLGNEKIGGFIEGGFGFKGFCTVGVNYRF